VENKRRDFLTSFRPSNLPLSVSCNDLIKEESEKKGREGTRVCALTLWISPHSVSSWTKILRQTQHRMKIQIIKETLLQRSAEYKIFLGPDTERSWYLKGIRSDCTDLTWSLVAWHFHGFLRIEAEVFPRPFRNAETARDEPYGPWGA